MTGLARLDVDVGEKVVTGSPLGMTGPGNPQVMVELRRDGDPVNPHAIYPFAIVRASAPIGPLAFTAKDR